MNAPRIPRQSRRAHQQDLLAERVGELEGRSSAQTDEVRQLTKGSSKDARKALLRPDGTLAFVFYCAASGRRGPVLQISCKVKGLPVLRTALSVDGKDFATVYARVVGLLADAFGVGEEDQLFQEMLATRDQFLELRGLRLVEVKYSQVLPAETS